ncbi:MAG: dioxygenase, partial [Bradyrhizobiaceae bacterium]|nr:dioxygenase [Bradyrhizobiaceae bacterium]
MTFPTLFLSHGSPTLAIEESPARAFLRSYGKTLGKPRAIVIASAHFETGRPAVNGDERPGMIYDFSGFPDALYRIVYPD